MRAVGVCGGDCGNNNSGYVKAATAAAMVSCPVAVAASAGGSGQSNERGQSEEEIAVMMAEQECLCTGDGQWTMRQELRWWQVAVANGATAAAALADSGHQGGTTVWRQVAVARGCRTRTHRQRQEEDTGCRCSPLYTVLPHSPPPLPSLPTEAKALDKDTTMGAAASGRGHQR
jgi:hypothetical protein